MTDPSAPENVAAFLTGLAELTDRYQLSVASCGCCASPWLQPLTRDTGLGVLDTGLTYDPETRQYTTDPRPAAPAAL